MVRGQAFTQRLKGRATRLINECGILKAVEPTAITGNEFVVPAMALWDTGATVSTISKKIVDALGLIPFSKSKVFHAGGEGVANMYKVNILLPNGVGVHAATVMEGVLNGFDALIGMDIITMGDFVITNRGGKTVFSFQIPPTHEYDFVKQIQNGVGEKKKNVKGRK